MPTSNSGNEPRSTAAQQISPARAPTAVPICSAERRPKVRASSPIGTVPNHMPNIITEIGSVARLGSGASISADDAGRSRRSPCCCRRPAPARPRAPRVAPRETVVDHNGGGSRRWPTFRSFPAGTQPSIGAPVDLPPPPAQIRDDFARSRSAPGCRIMTLRASAGECAPTWPSADCNSSMNRSMAWPGPSEPSAPRLHRNALPASAQLRAERQRARHVGAAAHAGVEQDGGLAADRLDDRRARNRSAPAAPRSGGRRGWTPGCRRRRSTPPSRRRPDAGCPSRSSAASTCRDSAPPRPRRTRRPSPCART